MTIEEETDFVINIERSFEYKHPGIEGETLFMVYPHEARVRTDGHTHTVNIGGSVLKASNQNRLGQIELFPISHTVAMFNEWLARNEVDGYPQMTFVNKKGNPGNKSLK